MKIVDLRTMRGPSYWSVKQFKLIVAKVDLQEFAGQWSNTVPGFAGRLVKLFPNIGQVQPSGMSGKQAAKHQPFTAEALADGEPLGHVTGSGLWGGQR